MSTIRYNDKDSKLTFGLKRNYTEDLVAILLGKAEEELVMDVEDFDDLYNNLYALHDGWDDVVWRKGFEVSTIWYNISVDKDRVIIVFKVNNPLIETDDDETIIYEYSKESLGKLVEYFNIKDEEQEGETKVLRMVKRNQTPTLVYIPRTRTLEIKTTTSTVVSVSFSESQWESFLTHAQDFVSLIDTRDEYAMLAVHSVGYSLQAGEEELYFILKGDLVAAVYTVPYNEAAKLIDFLRSE